MAPNYTNNVKMTDKQNAPAIGGVQLLLSFLMLIAGILTPPMTSKYFPEPDKFISKLQFGKDATILSKERNADLSTNTAEELEEEVVSMYVECNVEHLSQFYHEDGDMSEGAHIFCFTNDTFKFFENYHKESERMPLKGWKELTTDTIEGYLGVDHTTSQPWAIYSTTGERLAGELDGNEESIDLLKQHGMVILFEGGSWMWPGVRIGFKRQVDLVTGYPGNPETRLEIETLSMKPLVLSVKDFIAGKECDHIQNIAIPDMEYSEVSLMDKDKGRPASDFRTSQSAFVSAKDEIMHALEARTASLTRIPKNHQEHTQVLRYGYTEKYSAHVDYFDPKLYQQDQNTLHLIDDGRRNRLATVFWYLSDVEAGGHTVFPRFNGAPQPYDFDDCTKGLLVKPEKGKVIVFYSLLPDGKGDELSLHGACPVKNGIKWAANKWVWNAPMGYVH
jgi:hypothetical protein